MPTEEEKARSEIATFKEFAKISKLPIDPGSICKRNPPEPDILCLHLEEGLIAFELVEICDQALSKLIAKANEEFIWTSDPTPDIIARKLSKEYRTEHPIELLLYTNGRVVTPDDVIIPTVEQCVDRSKGEFRRIWLRGTRGVHLIRDFS